jgi:nucleoside-diphosphate-sugar epimerase
VVEPASGSADELPQFIQTEAELEDYLTRPQPALVEFIRQLPSPLLVLGAGGKMGPTLAAMAKRAADSANHPLEVIAVSRFSDHQSRHWLEGRGIRTVSADLLEEGEVAGLPDASNVIFLVGLKFGTTLNPSLTWAVNSLVPAYVMKRYAGARLVALSTGNVYPMVHSDGAVATEGHALTPLGEYANAAVARERIFEYFSQKYRTAVSILRLNYATELRYGVLVDIARKILANEPIELVNGFFNCIWQRDANEMILRSLAIATCPAQPWNLTSPAKISVREMAGRLGQLLGRQPKLTGQENPTALLSDSRKLCAVLGDPPTPLEAMLRWTAHWVRTGGRSLDKPTHFEVRDGRY